MTPSRFILATAIVAAWIVLAAIWLPFMLVAAVGERLMTRLGVVSARIYGARRPR